MPDDILISTTTIPNTAYTRKTPPYLVVLEKGKTVEYFITLDKPELSGNFVIVKGIYSNESEDEIIKSFDKLLTSTPKEAILEMIFTSGKICRIRNLIFRAK